MGIGLLHQAFHHDQRLHERSGTIGEIGLGHNANETCGNKGRHPERCFLPHYRLQFLAEKIVIPLVLPVRVDQHVDVE